MLELKVNGLAKKWETARDKDLILEFLKIRPTCSLLTNSEQAVSVGTIIGRPIDKASRLATPNDS